MNATTAMGIPLSLLLPPQLTAWPAGALAATAVLLTLSCLWLLSQQTDDWAKLPGPKPGSLLLGHLPQLSVPNGHRFFQDTAQQYGAHGMYRMRLLHKKIVVLTDPTLIQTIVSRSADLPKAPEIYDGVDELLSQKGVRSMFNTHSPRDWRLVRKATAPAFSSDNIRKTFPVLLNTVTELCDALAAKVATATGGTAAEGAVVDVDEVAMRATLDVIGHIGYGYDFKARSFAECELFEVIPPALAEFSLRETNPLRMVLHHLLPFLPEARLYRLRVEVCHKWWNMLLKNVRATDLEAAAATGDSSLRVCLARMVDPDTGVPVSDDFLLPNVGMFLVAGFETTAHSIGWALYEVASHPEVQAKVAAELAVAGLLGPSARQLAYADLAQLTYLNWVLKEAMRLHPVASNGTVRKAPKDISLGGFRLSRGTILWAPFIAMLTSQHNWQRPLDFWPERWAQEDAVRAAAATTAGGQAGQPGQAGQAGQVPAPGPTAVGNAANPAKTYLPFSDGPHDCIGQNLALMEARAVLAAVCGRFELAVAPEMGGREDVRGAEVMKLTLQCSKGMLLRLKPRQ